jgi:hypothetical protein
MFESATLVNLAWFDRVVKTVTETTRSIVHKRIKK